jgi:hypothetical protein
MPLRTPIEVNGVLVCCAGTTGISTGVHTHTQRQDKNGKVINPQGGGFDVPQPCYVTETGYRKDIGYYVRYKDGNGETWSQFHMDSPATVRVGQQLIKEEEVPLTQGQVDKAIKMGLRREPTQAELTNQEFANSAGLLIETLWNNGGEAFYKSNSTGFIPVTEQLFKKG